MQKIKEIQAIKEIIVIGSGNWGMTLAVLFCKKNAVRIWTIDDALASRINENRKEPGHFYNHPIPQKIKIEEKYASEFDESKTLFVMAVPSSQVRRAAKELAQHTTSPLVLSVSKGFDVDQQCTMSNVIKNEIPGSSVVVLTGPTIANEVADGLPTRAVLACEDLTTLALVKNTLKNDIISFEVGRNPSHHEICAALKGIIAIAVGMADGLEMGTNIMGVLMTQGLKEMTTVASFFDIDEDIAFGISGAGDLITTCISKDSRNRRLGAELAKGLTLEGALENVRMTVEGVAMSQTIETLWSLDVSIPLIHMVNGILRVGKKDIRRELTSLISNL